MDIHFGNKLLIMGQCVKITQELGIFTTHKGMRLYRQSQMVITS